ncbi:MAG: hypothetical protein HY040_02145 [Planctomycetes bacterium]|nr:hypothetical protein [Planctomycetota bacterium]
MKRLVALGCALATCMIVAGCGSNRREGVVATTLNKLTDAASKVQTIREKVETALKDADEKKIHIDSFPEAIKEADALGKVGKELQDEKREAEKFKEPATAEEQKQLAEQYRQRLNDAFDRLTSEKKKLNEVLIAAEQNHKEAVAELRTKIRAAEGEFEALIRLRS